MRETIARLRDWFRRDALDRELREELQFHRRQLERDARAAGAGADEARWAAARRLGNATRVHEEAREVWSIPSLDRLLQDVRHALRGLRRAPGFTLTVVVTLALGIGANAAMFDVVDRLMFRPLALLRDADTVHRLYWQWDDGGSTGTTTSTHYARYLDLRRWTTSFAQLAAFSERDLAVGTGADARERRVGVVSASFFTFFDAPPALGRYFTAAEDVVPRGADVAVLSYDFWQREYGARDVIGEPLQIGEIAATIVGVAPRGFDGMDDGWPPVAYVPITTYAGSGRNDDARTYAERYDWSWMRVLARRAPGVSVEQASADASLAFRRSWQLAAAQQSRLPSVESARPRVVVGAVRPGAGPDPGLEARTALWLGAVAAIVLLVAAANVTNLVLARALGRQRETAVRLALGVSRRRLVQAAVTESLLLAMLGGGAALAVAQWLGGAMRRLLLPASAPLPWVAMDARTLAVTLALVAVVGIVVGLVPALAVGRRDLSRTLRGGARGGRAEGRRVRTTLLVLQATLTVVLLVGAALFVQSLRAVQAMRLGYDAEPVLIVDRTLRGVELDDSARRVLRDELLRTTRALPGVEQVTWVSSAPFVSTSSTDIHVAGIDSTARLGEFTFQAATPGYFATMGTRILRGRALDEGDRAGAPEVLVVSASMADVLWPGQDALGQCVRVRDATSPCRTVVGIAEDMVQRDLGGERRYQFYLPIDQQTRTAGNRLLVRMRTDPAAEVERLRAALQRVMPGASYVTVQRLSDIVHDQQRSWRLGATMFAAFGLLALVVAAVGLYGVIAYDVGQRRHELGVRVALGAQRTDVVRLVTGQSLRLATVGIALGLAAAYGASRWIEPLLFRQSATDPRVYAAVCALMLLVALVAGARPALRAARADPNVALREE